MNTSCYYKTASFPLSLFNTMGATGRTGNNCLTLDVSGIRVVPFFWLFNCLPFIDFRFLTIPSFNIFKYFRLCLDDIIIRETIFSFICCSDVFFISINSFFLYHFLWLFFLNLGLLSILYNIYNL